MPVLGALSVTKSDKGVDVVGSLCHHHDATEEVVREALGSANKLIADILGKTPCAASDWKVENLENIDTGLSWQFFNVWILYVILIEQILL